MKKILLSSTIVVSLGAMGLSAAFAQGGPQGARRGPSFQHIDANGDGALTLDEFQNQGQARFARSDTNGDGMLDVGELTAAAERERGRMIERLMARKDINGDGMLSVEEMAPRDAGRFFERADADGDGAISQEEWEATKGKMRGHGPRGPDGMQDGNRGN